MDCGPLDHSHVLRRRALLREWGERVCFIERAQTTRWFVFNCSLGSEIHPKT